MFQIQEIVRISGLAPPTGAKFTFAGTASASTPAPQEQAIARQPSGGAGSKKCLQCNISVNGNFCPNCGSKCVAAPTGCVKCGGPDNGGKFCSSCGNPFVR